MGGALFGGLLMVLFWGALIALAFFAVRAILRSSQNRAGSQAITLSGPGPSRALEILQERYARGEITRAEYEELRRDLAG